MFGANLRTLSASALSIAELCRDLGINRTQFNRYLSGEAFPRPDVLDQICRYFGVDARILLEPLETQSNKAGQGYAPLMLDRSGRDDMDRVMAAPDIDFARMPLGPCLLYWRSFLKKDYLSVNMGLSVVRPDGKVGMISIMPRKIAHAIGLSVRLKDRRRIGEMYQHPTGVSFALRTQGTGLRQFAFMEYSYMGNADIYAGECMNTLRFGHLGRISDLILMERLKPTRAAMIAARRQIGYKSIMDMKPVIQGYFTQADT
ncbi:helix-turn-helix domain-containing protein [Pacificibacter marinus]|nr:helix-turn-helix domain-containing protein [Pacificibacter marinus]